MKRIPLVLSSASFFLFTLLNADNASKFQDLNPSTFNMFTFEKEGPVLTDETLSNEEEIAFFQEEDKDDFLEDIAPNLEQDTQEGKIEENIASQANAPSPEIAHPLQNTLNPEKLENSENELSLQSIPSEVKDQKIVPEEDALLKDALTVEKDKIKTEEVSSSIPQATANLLNEKDKIALSNSLVEKPLKKATLKSAKPLEINLGQVFSGSPVIYSLLTTMSILSLGICLYSILSLRKARLLPVHLEKNIKNKLLSNHYDDAFSLCLESDNLLCKMLASGIAVRNHGLQFMIETMKAEGKRITVGFWQKLALLNDVAIVAPMLGLLGTVLGMFYAFYDLNRSKESVTTLFDGLGISVGTTVAGLIVAILAMILHSISKYRIVNTLAYIENEAQTYVTLIDNKTTIYPENKGV
jgi:biopolymer transport protein ExbB